MTWSSKFGTGMQDVACSLQLNKSEPHRPIFFKLAARLPNWSPSGPSPAGVIGARPPFEIGDPPFHIWPPGCYIYPILYFNNVTPPSGFWPPLLLNPGDGPGPHAVELNPGVSGEMPLLNSCFRPQLGGCEACGNKALESWRD